LQTEISGVNSGHGLPVDSGPRSNVVDFSSLSKNVGRFDFRHKTLLIPEMNRIGCHLLAGVFRSFDIDAVVMPTYQGLEVGMEYTSGKECYPCQVTLGDVLFFLERERQRLGANFDAGNYVYFMPEAEGPCRFGMYNKFQKIILDSIPEFSSVKIGALSTRDGYSLEGLVDSSRIGVLRRAAYLSVVVADVMDRLLWRIRPYEREKGAADQLIKDATTSMANSFERYGIGGTFSPILDAFDGVLKQGVALMDPGIPRKPRIGVVGEIYLRTHVLSNQDTIRNLERFGAEAVNASIAEWVNFTTYEKILEFKSRLSSDLKTKKTATLFSDARQLLGYKLELLYQQRVQSGVYRRARRIIDLADDHRVGHLDRIVKKHDLYDFRIGTEASLSIAAAMSYVEEGYNGVVNIFPFTCMPGAITSSIAKPLMQRLGVPYLDAPYDSSSQPGREGALRTFMFQAKRHFSRSRKAGDRRSQADA
jgi:predicted nucleotide-binding protein (sugar kinase/HSP70/actin superfamily)